MYRLITRFCIWYTVILVPGSAVRAAFDTLGMELPGRITSDHSPYRVVNDIVVPLGRTVTIEEGVVLMFKSFTTMRVEGKLMVKGTAGRPVIFTSEYDRRYNYESALNPNPYDWNGIQITENAIGSSMEHFELRYSVFGIQSHTKFISIDKGLFQHNGKSDVVIEGEIQEVASGKPFSYYLTKADATVDGVPARIIYDPRAMPRNILRYSGLTVFAGGCAVGLWYTMQFREADRELSSLTSNDPSVLIAHTEQEWKEARDRRNRNVLYMVIGYTISVIGLGGFGMSFTF